MSDSSGQLRNSIKVARVVVALDAALVDHARSCDAILPRRSRNPVPPPVSKWYNPRVNWISQRYAWLFDGVGGAVLVGVLGWLINRFRDSTHGSVSGSLAATSTHGNVSVSGSPVASGKDISQMINAPTVNVAIHSDHKQTAEDAAQEAARELLQSERWKKRSFSEIKARLSGFQDDKLRRILVSAGAVRFRGENSEELWGLRDRNPAPEGISEIRTVATPSLRFVQASEIRLVEFAGKWQEYDDGPYRGIIAIFRNEPSELGQHTKTVRDVTSHLTYRNPGNQAEQELHINFGAWVGEYTRYVTFGPGQTHSLIVALQKTNKMLALENPRRANPLSGRWRPGIVVYLPDEKEIGNLSGRVEITLVDGSNLTVFMDHFAYELELGVKMSLTRL